MNIFLHNFLIDKEDLNIPEVKELLARVEERVFLLIKARWIFIAILLAYSLFALVFYRVSDLFHIVEKNYLVPTAVFLFLISYNSWYHITYKWFSRIKGINQIQIIFDVVYVTILIHYSGGLLSWLWALYPLLIIEIAFLTEERLSTIILTVFCILIYGGVVILEYYQYIPHFNVPMTYGLEHNLSYILLFMSWFAFILVCFAVVSTYLMGVINKGENDLKRQVVIDGLTKLYNRSYFFYRLNSEIERSRRFGHTASLLLRDIDGFKEVNDNFGHLEGDFLLKKAAEVFKKNIRRYSNTQTYDVDIPCRFGGDEFAIILPETKEGNAAMVGERIRKDLLAEGNKYLRERNLNKTTQKYFNLSLSIGVASYPAHADNTDDLLSKADAALYHAKLHGKNRVVIASELVSSEI